MMDIGCPSFEVSEVEKMKIKGLFLYLELRNGNISVVSAYLSA